MAANRFLLQQVFSRLVLPPLPPYAQGREIAIADEAYNMSDNDLKSAILNLGTVESQYWKFGMKLSGESDYWYFPVEPLVSLSCKNNIIRRNVAKNTGVQGTVKERWSRDDYTVSISGILRNFNDSSVYPYNDIQALKYYCEAAESIEVECPLLVIFGITRMAIENFEIPFTKGEDMQAYSITAYSDNLFELLIDTESV